MSFEQSAKRFEEIILAFRDGNLPASTAILQIQQLISASLASLGALASIFNAACVGGLIGAQLAPTSIINKGRLRDWQTSGPGLFRSENSEASALPAGAGVALLAASYDPVLKSAAHELWTVLENSGTLPAYDEREGPLPGR